MINMTIPHLHVEANTIKEIDIKEASEVVCHLLVSQILANCGKDKIFNAEVVLRDELYSVTITLFDEEVGGKIMIDKVILKNINFNS